MKMTLDLPNDLVRELKLRAVHEERRIKDVVADLIASGLTAEPAGKPGASQARKEPLKLPLFPCAPDAPARHMTLADLLALEQETQTLEDFERLGLPL